MYSMKFQFNQVEDQTEVELLRNQSSNKKKVISFTVKLLSNLEEAPTFFSIGTQIRLKNTQKTLLLKKTQKTYFPTLQVTLVQNKWRHKFLFSDQAPSFHFHLGNTRVGKHVFCVFLRGSVFCVFLRRICVRILKNVGAYSKNRCRNSFPEA